MRSPRSICLPSAITGLGCSGTELSRTSPSLSSWPTATSRTASLSFFRPAGSTRFRVSGCCHLHEGSLLSRGVPGRTKPLSTTRRSGRLRTSLCGSRKSSLWVSSWISSRLVARLCSSVSFTVIPPEAPQASWIREQPANQTVGSRKQRLVRAQESSGQTQRRRTLRHDHAAHGRGIPCIRRHRAGTDRAVNGIRQLHGERTKRLPGKRRMSSFGSGSGSDWQFIRFGLIVTGDTEEKCLPELFRLIAATGMCSFKVIRKIGQRSPIRIANTPSQDDRYGQEYPRQGRDLNRSIGPSLPLFRNRFCPPYRRSGGGKVG